MLPGSLSDLNTEDEFHNHLKEFIFLLFSFYFYFYFSSVLSLNKAPVF